jgi:hypothetical protein
VQGFFGCEAPSITIYNLRNPSDGTQNGYNHNRNCCH